MVTAAEVLSRLTHVRKTTRGWTACCPAHDDRSPSLSVTVGTGGRILLRCWSGCAFQEIAGALGLRPGDLSPGRPRPQTAQERRAAKEQEEERHIERALETWADRAYIRLAALRRLYFSSISSPDAYSSSICTRLDHLDHILDGLQFGNYINKLAVLRAAKAGKLSFIGEVIL